MENSDDSEGESGDEFFVGDFNKPKKKPTVFSGT